MSYNNLSNIIDNQPKITNLKYSKIYDKDKYQSDFKNINITYNLYCKYLFCCKYLFYCK